MKRRGNLLFWGGIVILLFVPWFVITFPQFDEPGEAPTEEEIRQLQEEASALGTTTEWLARGWRRFLSSSAYDWLERSETPEKKAEELENIREAIAGLEKEYGIRVIIWLLLGLATMGTGFFIRKSKGYGLAWLIILFWLGGSPIPNGLVRWMPDENDMILLAGLLPMLIALTVLAHRGWQLLEALSKRNVVAVRIILAVIVLLIMAGGIAVIVAEGGIQEEAVITTVIGAVVTIVLGGLIALFKR
ncbi:MAG: hypothetical protein AAF585_18210 [Verrucomicrobiota bacterium]